MLTIKQNKSQKGISFFHAFFRIAYKANTH